MKTLLNLSVYDSPALMVVLFVCGTLIIFLMIAVKPSERNKAPMHYVVVKRELPEDDDQERAANYLWLGIITAIIIYYCL